MNVDLGSLKEEKKKAKDWGRSSSHSEHDRQVSHTDFYGSASGRPVTFGGGSWWIPWLP